MKHFTFTCLTVMSLTIIASVLSGCKEPNNSSPEQTVETSANESAANDAASENTADKSIDNLTIPELKAQIKEPEIPEVPELQAPELPEIETPEVPELTPPALPDAEPEAAPEVPELTPPAAPETTEAAPEVPELTPPAAPEATEAAPEVPELTTPVIPEEESPAVAPEVPELTPPATPETPEAAPEVPELTTPVIPEEESPAVAPEVPELTPPAASEVETPEVAPEVPELTPPAASEAETPETAATPQMESELETAPDPPALALTDTESKPETETAPEVPELKIPSLLEVKPQAPVASDVIQTEDMGLAELPDSAGTQAKQEPQEQTENAKAVQPETIAPKPTQTAPAQPQTVQQSPTVTKAPAVNLVNPEAVKIANENPKPNTTIDAQTPSVSEPKWESKNNATDLQNLKEDAAKLVQSELQKLDDSLDLNLVEQSDAAESRVIPPPDRTAADEPAALPAETAQASEIPADTPNNPLLEDIPQLPQQENVPADNSNVAAAPVNDQPTEPVQTEENAPKEIVKAPFDPIKENGPIFVGWDVPKVALVITGQQNGYLEPCGCAGLDRMRGGLSRRYSFMKGLREKGWPVIALDVGGMCNSFGKQAELKFHTTASALRAMGYNAIALGKAELGFPAADILSEIVNADGTPGMFVSANVSVFERNQGMPQMFKILQANGLKFGITSVLCKSAQNFSPNDEILLSPTKESLNKVMPILKEKSDIRILLSHGTVEEALKIANDYPDFQVIVTAGGNPEPPPKPVILPSGQYIITVGQKGMYSIVLGFFDKGVLKYQRVPYDSRFEQSDVIRQLMQSYQDQLKELWLDGLGIRPVPQTDASRGANVGPKKCQTCHEYQYDVWKKSKHAHAFKSLEEAKPSRDFDPECVCCHVVGWHRHLYFPYQKGYVKPGEDDYLKNVSCEACHGPGEAHIAAESSSSVENQKAQRAKMHLDLKYAKEKMCGDCHDLDNSPDFDPDKYWELVKHHDPEDDQ